MLPLSVSVGQYSPDCDSMQFAMTPMTSIAASSRLKEGVENLLNIVQQIMIEFL